MIRFHCPHCHRRSELPEALARLAIVCKGCGQPLTVPEKSTDPEPEPQPQISTPAPIPAPPSPEPPRVTAPEPPPAPVLAPAPAPVAVLTENRLPPDRPSTNGPPSAHSTVNGLFEKPDVLAALEVGEPLPPPAPSAPRQMGGSKRIGIVVDGVVALTLVAIGVFCGEILARQSTSEVLRDASSAAKFPPIDLLMWLAPPVLLLLIYGLLISRGQSIGRRIRA